MHIETKFNVGDTVFEAAYDSEVKSTDECETCGHPRAEVMVFEPRVYTYVVRHITARVRNGNYGIEYEPDDDYSVRLNEEWLAPTYEEAMKKAEKLIEGIKRDEESRSRKSDD